MALPARKTNPIIDLHRVGSENSFDVTVRMGNYLVTYEAEILGFGELDPDKINVIQQFTKAALTALSNTLAEKGVEENSIVLDSLQADGIHGRINLEDSSDTEQPSEFITSYSELTTLPALVVDKSLAQKLQETQRQTAQKTANISAKHFSLKNPDPIWNTVLAYNPPKGSTKPYIDVIPPLPEGNEKKKEKQRSLSEKSKTTAPVTQKESLPKEEDPTWKEFDEQIGKLQKLIPNTGLIPEATLQSKEAKELLKRFESLKQKLEKYEVTEEAKLVIQDKIFAVDVAIILLNGRKQLVGFENPYDTSLALIELLAPPKQRNEIYEAFIAYARACLKGKDAKKEIEASGQILIGLLPKDSILLDVLHNFGLILQLEKSGALSNKAYALLIDKKQLIHDRLESIGIAFDPHALSGDCSPSVVWVFYLIPRDPKYQKDFISIADDCETYFRAVAKNPANAEAPLKELKSKIEKTLASKDELKKYAIKHAEELPALLQKLATNAAQSKQSSDANIENAVERLATAKKELLKIQKEIEESQVKQVEKLKNKEGTNPEISQSLKTRLQQAQEEYKLAREELENSNQQWLESQANRPSPSVQQTSKSTTPPIDKARAWIQEMQTQIQELEGVDEQDIENGIEFLQVSEDQLKEYYQSTSAKERTQIAKTLEKVMNEGAPDLEIKKCPDSIKKVIKKNLLEIRRSSAKGETDD